MSYIKEFHGKDFKKIRVVDLILNPNLNIIRGENKQGKTSCLDAIATLLGGEKLAPKDPIRHGAKRAPLSLVTDDGIRVERVFTPSGSTLTVSNGSGAVKKPQEMLDSLLGSIAFDPLEFAEMKPGLQAAYLAQLTGIDFAALNAKKDAAFAERTIINRTVKQLETKVAEARKPIAGKEQEAYAQEMRSEDVTAELKAAQGEHQSFRTLSEEQRALRSRMANCENDIIVAKKALFAKEAELMGLQQRFAENQQIIEQKSATLPDLDAITAKFSAVESHNRISRQFGVLGLLAEDLSEAQRAAETLTGTIEAADTEKAALVKNVNLPVKGLTFSEDGVYYNDVSFAEASDAEKLLVSCTLAMKMNPTLRVGLIDNGEKLDRKMLAKLEEICQLLDFQIIITRVDDSKDGAGILIEDGEVVN